MHSHDVGTFFLAHGGSDGLDILHEVFFHGGIQGGVKGCNTIFCQILGHGQNRLGGTIFRSVSLKAMDVGIDKARGYISSFHIVDLGGSGKFLLFKSLLTENVSDLSVLNKYGTFFHNGKTTDEGSVVQTNRHKTS